MPDNGAMEQREGLTAHWAAGWADEPERVVITDRATGRRWRAAELEAATAAGARDLAARGLGPGDAVVLSAAPGDVTALAFIALLRLGCVVVPVNTAATPREITHVRAVSGATHAVTDGEQRFAGILPTTSPLAPILAPADAPAIALDERTADDWALICFTSGTTGAPKGAPLSHGNVLAGTRALQQCWDWRPDDVLVSALPLFHVHGLLVALAGTLTSRASIILHDHFDAAAVVDSVIDAGASLLFGVPTMWSRIADAGRLDDLRGLRLPVSGSAPLSPALFERLEAGLGQAPVERYGMTETMIITSTPLDGPRRAGAVGRPLPGMDVRLADDGVVEVRGPSVFSGYLTESPTSPPLRTSFTDDGWFRTGDIGEWDGPDLRLVGRASELIITGGYNVYPREVEDVLRSDPGIVDAAVVGIPDDTWGEVVTAFLVIPGDVVADEVTTNRWRELCARELAPYKQPRRWHVVDELPRNAMGKVLRDDLRARGVAAR